MTIPDPATANEGPPGLIDPFDLTYSDHIHALKNAGEVFNIDNLEIVTPLFHAVIGR